MNGIYLWPPNRKQPEANTGGLSHLSAMTFLFVNPVNLLWTNANLFCCGKKQGPQTPKKLCIGIISTSNVRTSVDEKWHIIHA